MPDVFIVAGQSNAVGYGKPLNQDLDCVQHNKVLCWNHRKRLLEPANSPLPHPDGSKHVGVGFAYHFARLHHAATCRSVVLVPCAKGGTGFVEGSWKADGSKGKCVAWVMEASSSAISASGGVLKGFLWHQGEQDIRDHLSFSEYSDAILRLVSFLRSEIPGAARVPFLYGGISDQWARSGDAKLFAGNLSSLEKYIPDSIFISSNGLSVMEDNRVHFDPGGQREFAVRYYAGYAAHVAKNRFRPHMSIINLQRSSRAYLK